MEVFFGLFLMFFAALVIVYVVDSFCAIIGGMDQWINK